MELAIVVVVVVILVVVQIRRRGSRLQRAEELRRSADLPTRADRDRGAPPAG